MSTIRNKILDVIHAKEKSEFIRFKPSPEFYSKIGIRRKRWAQLVKNEKQPDLLELEAISKFFGVAEKELF